MGATLTESFEYELSDGDTAKEGTDTATLTITITGGEPQAGSIVPEDHNGSGDTNGHNAVSEKGLRPGASDESHIVSGSIAVSADSGIASVTIGGRSIPLDELKGASTGTPLTIEMDHGTLEIVGFTPKAGEDVDAPREGSIEYRYTLRARVDHFQPADDEARVDEVGVGVQGRVGAPGVGSLKIQIEDDVPEAVADTADVVTWTPTAAGNVYGNDTIGADAPHADGPVTGVEAGDTRGAVSGGLGADGVAGTYGKLILNTDGSYSYSLDQEHPDVKGLTGGQTLVDIFTYTITDADGDTATATLTITIRGNSVPVAEPDVRTTPEDTPVSGNVIFAGGDGDTPDRDPDDDPLKVTQIVVDADGDGTPETWAVDPATPLHVTIDGKGSLEIRADGSYTFTPVPDWHGDVPPVTYTVTDGKGGEATSTLTITVTPVDDTVNDRDTTIVNVPVTVEPLENDSFSGESPTVSVEPGDGPLNGTVVVHPDGSITYTPEPGFVGEDTFTYTVESGGTIETATVTITVSPRPVVPVQPPAPEESVEPDEPVDPEEPMEPEEPGEPEEHPDPEEPAAPSEPLDPQQPGQEPPVAPGDRDPQEDVRYQHPVMNGSNGSVPGGAGRTQRQRCPFARGSILVAAGRGGQPVHRRGSGAGPQPVRRTCRSFGTAPVDARRQRGAGPPGPHQSGSGWRIARAHAGRSPPWHACFVAASR